MGKIGRQPPTIAVVASVLLVGGLASCGVSDSNDRDAQGARHAPRIQEIATAALDDDTSQGTQRRSRRHPALSANGKIRDPRVWPYRRNSIWNTPLGSKARLVPLNITRPEATTLSPEEDIIVVTPDAPSRPVYYSPVGWTGDGDRCARRTSRVLLPAVPVAADFFTDPGFYGLTPNHSAAIVLPDGRLIETQPFHACPDGSLVSKVAFHGWRQSSIRTGGTPKDPGWGAHGGSSLTAFGGTIRLGEWVPGGSIPHAVKIELSGAYLSQAFGGFRWPARNSDQHFLTQYAGQIVAARMGALLALPPNFHIERLESPAAKILARALRRYGAYIVDTTGNDRVAFAVEWGPAGRVIDEFQQVWGFPLQGDEAESIGPHQLFLHDMLHIYRRLSVVDNNSAKHPGGRGERLAPWAPKLGRWPKGHPPGRG